MVLRELTSSEADEEYQENWKKLQPGVFFTVSTAESSRILLVRKILNDKELSVFEVSHPDNVSQLLQDDNSNSNTESTVIQPKFSTYTYDSDDCLNIIKTAPEDPEYKQTQKRFANIKRFYEANYDAIVAEIRQNYPRGRQVFVVVEEGTWTIIADLEKAMLHPSVLDKTGVLKLPRL